MDVHDHRMASADKQLPCSYVVVCIYFLINNKKKKKEAMYIDNIIFPKSFYGPTGLYVSINESLSHDTRMRHATVFLF